VKLTWITDAEYAALRAAVRDLEAEVKSAAKSERIALAEVDRLIKGPWHLSAANGDYVIVLKDVLDAMSAERDAANKRCEIQAVALLHLRDACRNNLAMQGREYDSLGIEVNDALRASAGQAT